MPNQQGMRSTQQSITTENRLVRVPDERMMMLEAKETAFTTFLLAMNRKKVIESPRIEHYEDEFMNPWVVAPSAIAANAGSGTFSLTDGTGVVVGDILMIPSGTSAPHERVRVIAKPSDNVATVVRNIGNTGLLPVAAGAALAVLGSAYEEGSGAPVAKRTTPTLVSNFLQIFKKSANITGTDANSKQYANEGSERTRQRQKIMREYKIAKNYAYLWGSPSESLNGGPTGQPIRTTGGLYHFIQSNKFDAAGMLTQKDFETWSRMCFRYGSKEKLLLASSLIVSAIHMWGNGLMRLEPMAKTYGVDISRLRTGHGTWLLTNDWSLQDPVASQPGLGGYAFSIDMDRVQERYLKNRDTSMKLNVEPNDEDRDLDLIIGETGMQVYNEKCHSFMWGVTDYES